MMMPDNNSNRFTAPEGIWKLLVLSFFCLSPTFALVGLQTYHEKFGPEPADVWVGFNWLLRIVGPVVLLLVFYLRTASPRVLCNPVEYARCRMLIFALAAALLGSLIAEPRVPLEPKDYLDVTDLFLIPIEIMLIISLTRLTKLPPADRAAAEQAAAAAESDAKAPVAAPAAPAVRASPEEALGIDWIAQRDSNTCVLFASGVFSSTRVAFTHANGTYWPDLVAAEEGLNAAVCTYNYRTDLLCRDYNPEHILDHMRDCIDLEQILRYRNIIIAGHSMGGIIGRGWVVNNVAQLIDNRNRIGMCLVASPSFGSRDADAVHVLARLFGNSQLEALRTGEANAWLSDLDKKFFDLKEERRRSSGGNDEPLLPIFGKEMIENEAVPIKKVFGRFSRTVEPASAARYFGRPIMIPYSDHWSIAKLANRKALQHRLLVQLIRDIQAKKTD